MRRVKAGQRGFASCPRGLEELLAEELRALGVDEARPAVGGVRFAPSLVSAYRACLWSRIASRVMLVIAEFPSPDAEELYAGVADIPWEAHLPPGATIAVDFIGTSDSLRNSLFSARRVKDAIVDRMRALTGERPNVDLEAPDIRVVARLHRGRTSIAIDLAGAAQHRRGYRTAAGTAPLKENLAAAILLRSGWPGIAGSGGALYDPMCGSATLLIEGALIAAGLAPGADRSFGFEKWLGHDSALWERLRGEALQRRQGALAALPPIAGADVDARVLGHARTNVAAAGFEGRIALLHAELAAQRRPDALKDRPGLLVCNPPYGERLGDAGHLRECYAELGRLIRQEFGDWRAAVLTAEGPLGDCLGLRPTRQYHLRNGPIDCRLLVFEQPGRVAATLRRAEAAAQAPAAADASAAPEPLSEGAQMIANRLRRNLRRLKPWLATAGTDCFRVYDADIPEYAVAVDRYGDWLHVAEYSAPASVDALLARRRLDEVRAAVVSVFAPAKGHVVVKTRSRQRGNQQYQRLAREEHYVEVTESPARFLVNLRDYLDTGLFLDHRPVRRMIGEMARGKRFLNLFCYTATATVHAGLGGARETTSVDLSANYLTWAGRNLALNGLDRAHHRIERADCLRWMQEQRRRWDLIFLDPPSFSNSRGMRGTLDVQRDHVALIRAALALLSPGGTLVFSTNRRGFRLDREGLSDAIEVRDLTERSFDPDFARGRTRHRVYLCYKPNKF